MSADKELVTDNLVTQDISLDIIQDWYRRARHKYVWDAETFNPYHEVIAEIVYGIIEDQSDDREIAKGFVSEEIGLIGIVESEETPSLPWAYALYILQGQYWSGGKATILSRFKDNYKIAVGTHNFFGFGYLLNYENFIRKQFPDRADFLIERTRKRSKLVKTFESFADKSLNHRRSISKRVRYQVLQRDNSTCQNCGRRAPEVRVHIDHKLPVSWDIDWKPSDNPSNYQVLCEDCNIGKGDMRWLFEL
jgi:5-methylcytosine-specific restriction endonuclease McrA